jgi:hypothetical protein
MRRTLTRLLSVLGLTGASIFAAAGPVSVTHANVRFESSVVDGKLRESFWARKGTTWVLIAGSDGRTQGALSIRGAGDSILPGNVSSISQNGDAVAEEIRGDGWTVKRTLEGFGKSGWIRIVTVLTPERPLTLHSFADSFRTGLKPDWSFSPSVGGFNPDAKYKAALILVQSGPAAFGIVPDVLTLNRASLKRCNHSLDLGVAGNASLSVGYIPAKQAYHAVFKEDLDRTWIASERVVNRYYVYLTADAPPREAYREAVRFHWNQFGRQALSKAADEQAGTDSKYLSCHLWEEWRRTVWDRESSDSWLTVPMPDGTTGGAVMMHRAHAPKPSVYLGAWFNSLRTAYGMALYARRTNNNNLMALARQTLNLAVKAPGRDGAFKCFAVPRDTNDPRKLGDVFWGAGDGAGASVSSGYLGFDMSWTGYWLLKWKESNLPGSESILARCTRLADFLVARQRPNGLLPTRFDDDGEVQEELSATVPAETAPIARFLFELWKVGNNPKYLQAALKALAFLDGTIVPERKWYDFETFWSCSPRLVAFDKRTRQWPANNLALIHAVAAYLQAYEITRQPAYLSKGQALLDYLLLYQQSWTNPALEDLTGPFMLLGGFTTQNSDAEWSDARQSLAGEVIMDYYRATHNAEYLERGVEALRSQFPVSPSENWAHAGYGRKAGVSSFHWGTGSGMAGIEFEDEYLRDAVCDVRSERCVGVNGLNITSWEMAGDGQIELKMDSPYHWTRKPEIVFHNVEANRGYKISVNGSPPQSFSGKQLESGVAVAMPLQTHQTIDREPSL